MHSLSEITAQFFHERAKHGAVRCSLEAFREVRWKQNPPFCARLEFGRQIQALMSREEKNEFLDLEEAEDYSHNAHFE